MNGGLCNALTTAANDRQLERRAVAFGSRSRRRRRAARRRAGIVVVLERKRAVLAAEQLVDEALHLAVAQRGVGALHQVRAHASSAGSAEQRFEHAAHPRGSDARRARARSGTRGDAVGDRGERLGAPVVDRAVEQLADEPLVRRREQERVAERRVHRRSRAAAPRSAPATCRGRGRRRARSARRRARPPRPAAARSRRNARHVGDEIVVVRFGIGDARLQADVRRDDGRARAWRRRSGSRDRRSRRCRCRRPRPPCTRRRAPTRATCRPRAARRSAPRAPRSRARHGRAPRPRRPPGPGPAFTPPTSSRSAPSTHELLGAREERVERPRRAPVVERVGRPVEDAHHHRVARDVDRSVTEAQGGIRDDGHAGRPYASPGRRSGSERPDARLLFAVRAVTAAQTEALVLGAAGTVDVELVARPAVTGLALRPQIVEGRVVAERDG